VGSEIRWQMPMGRWRLDFGNGEIVKGEESVQALFGSVLEHEGFCVSAHEFQHIGYVLVLSVCDSAVVARKSVTVSAYVVDCRRRITQRS
jgi:hypothetical protein